MFPLALNGENMFEIKKDRQKLMSNPLRDPHYVESRLAMLRRCLKDIEETIALCKDSPNIQKMIDRRDEIKDTINKMFTDAEQYIDTNPIEKGE